MFPDKGRGIQGLDIVLRLGGRFKDIIYTIFLIKPFRISPKPLVKKGRKPLHICFKNDVRLFYK
jgi:hypothetical protein